MVTRSSAALTAALKNLPPFPPVACKVMNMLSREHVSFREAADVMKTDPALCAEVLRLTNSAAMGKRYRVSSILEALAIIGTERLAGLLLTLSFSKLLKRCGCTTVLRRSWQHSLASALAAREFAPSFDCDIEQAYLAGLFHDLGRFALLVLEPNLYDRWLAQEQDLRELETAHFGVDHCRAGVLLIHQWKLPAVFANVALNHHEPKLDADKLTQVVHASCSVANRLGFSLRPPQIPPDLSEPLGFSIAETINLLECEYGI